MSYGPGYLMITYLPKKLIANQRIDQMIYNPIYISKGKPPLGAPLITTKEQNHIMNAKAAIAETEGSLNSPLSASNMLR